MDTFTQLQTHWTDKHFKHLQYCLKYCQAYFEDHFEYEENTKEKTLLINGELVTEKDIIKILSDYYDDNTNDYYSAFGDALYLFFTDLVEDDVNILSKLDEEEV